jgi:hypothetical protein
MGYELEFVDNGRKVILSCYDSFSGADLIDIIAEVYSDEDRLKKLRYQLCDVTRVTELDMSNNDVKALIELEKKAVRINRDRMIAVTATSEITYGMARVWKSYMDVMVWDIKSMIFRDREAAFLWFEGNSKMPESASSGSEPSVLPREIS